MTGKRTARRSRSAAGSCIALAAAAFCAVAWPGGAAAGGLSVGAGVVFPRVSSDALERDGTGTGWEVSFGWRMLERLSLDLHAASLGTDHPTRATTAIYYPPDTAEAGMLGIGLRLDVLAMEETRWTPWIGVGVGVAMLNWQTFFLIEQGSGAYFAAGADFEVVTGLLLRGRIAYLSVGTQDNYGHDTPSISITTASLSLVYEFGRTRRAPAPEGGATPPSTPSPPTQDGSRPPTPAAPEPLEPVPWSPSE